MKAMAVRTRGFEFEPEGISIGSPGQAAVVLLPSFVLRNRTVMAVNAAAGRAEQFISGP
jgi:hypothetical protein